MSQMYDPNVTFVQQKMQRLHCTGKKNGSEYEVFRLD